MLRPIVRQQSHGHPYFVKSLDPSCAPRRCGQVSCVRHAVGRHHQVFALLVVRRQPHCAQCLSHGAHGTLPHPLRSLTKPSFFAPASPLAQSALHILSSDTTFHAFCAFCAFHAFRAFCAFDVFDAFCARCVLLFFAATNIAIHSGHNCRFRCRRPTQCGFSDSAPDNNHFGRNDGGHNQPCAGYLKKIAALRIHTIILFLLPPKVCSKSHPSAAAVAVASSVCHVGRLHSSRQRLRGALGILAHIVSFVVPRIAASATAIATATRPFHRR